MRLSPGKLRNICVWVKWGEMNTLQHFKTSLWLYICFLELEKSFPSLQMSLEQGVMEDEQFH